MTRSVWRVAVVGVLAVGLAACGGPASPRPPASAAAPAAGSGKALTGLIDMGSQKPYELDQPFPVTDPAQLGSDAAAFSGMVVNLDWAQLEPVAGKPDWAALDASLAAIAAYDRAHPATPLQAKLRIFPGYGAPAWAKALDGGPIAVTSEERGHGEAASTVGE